MFSTVFKPSDALQRAGYGQRDRGWEGLVEGRLVVATPSDTNLTVFAPMDGPPLGPSVAVDGVTFSGASVKDGGLRLTEFWGVMTDDEVLRRLGRRAALAARDLEQPPEWRGLKSAFPLEHEDGVLRGTVGTVDVTVCWKKDAWQIEASCPEAVLVQAGQGDSGNVVLDSLARTRGVPETAVGPALELFREHGGQVGEGRIVLRSLALTAGFAAVVRLASALVGEVAPALPIVSRGPTKEWLVRREDEMDRWRIWAVPLLAAGALAWVGMLWPSADLIGRLVWVPYAFFLGSLGASSLLRRRGHAPSTARLLQSLAGPWGAAVALIQKPRCAWCGTPRPQPPCANCGYDGQ